MKWLIPNSIKNYPLRSSEITELASPHPLKQFVGQTCQTFKGLKSCHPTPLETWGGFQMVVQVESVIS
ncbi:MAG TPA: hypothetical protein EYP59_02145 [Thiotrichaceae bacterium]|nr:hypothetical protein [Thiotrichaceae bacterium]